jgi:hypothetical protein
VAAALIVLPACKRGAREAYVTYFDRQHAVTLRHPPDWSSQATEPAADNPSYRYFSSPARADAKSGAVTASLLATSGATSIDDYAATLLAGATPTRQGDFERQGAKGRFCFYAKGEGRVGFVLMQGDGILHGLFVQGGKAAFEAEQRTIDELMTSFSLERPSTYMEQKNEAFGYSVRIPPSWKESRRLQSTSANMAMVQFVSPPLAIDRDRSTVHISLTLTAEPLAGGGLDAFYTATRKKLGLAIKVTSHTPWNDGYVDTESIETPVAMSRAKRFYRVSGDRAYTLSFEARDDVFHRASAWCDLIASTFTVLSSKPS